MFRRFLAILLSLLLAGFSSALPVLSQEFSQRPVEMRFQPLLPDVSGQDLWSSRLDSGQRQESPWNPPHRTARQFLSGIQGLWEGTSSLQDTPSSVPTNSDNLSGYSHPDPFVRTRIRELEETIQLYQAKIPELQVEVPILLKTEYQAKAEYEAKKNLRDAVRKDLEKAEREFEKLQKDYNKKRSPENLGRLETARQWKEKKEEDFNEVDAQYQPVAKAYVKAKEEREKKERLLKNMQEEIPFLVALIGRVSQCQYNPQKDPLSEIGHRDVTEGKNLPPIIDYLWDYNYFSLEAEIYIGTQLSQQFERQNGQAILKDSLVQNYIQGLCDRLAPKTDLKIPLNCKVLHQMKEKEREAEEPEEKPKEEEKEKEKGKEEESEEPKEKDDLSINAFALPGGFIYVTTGLMLEAKTESELAGVLAHEIAHVAARHGTRAVSQFKKIREMIDKGMMAAYILDPVGLYRFLLGPGGYLFQYGLAFGLPLAFIQYSRGFEDEADRLGTEYAYHAGFNPRGSSEFFEIMRKKEIRGEIGTLPKIFSDHSPSRDRTANVELLICEKLPPIQSFQLSSSDFHIAQDWLQERYGLDRRRDLRAILERQASPQDQQQEEHGPRPTLKKKPVPEPEEKKGPEKKE
ncbi:MAG: M48 family metalloprotease [Elusimicrobia bacterium]|nr:M48 family metalloprotease [Elusimicrobiota bacterium]